MHTEAMEVVKIDRVSHHWGEGRPTESLEALLRCSAPFDEYVYRVAEFLRANPNLRQYPSNEFSVLDSLMEHIESRIFYSTEADELIYSLKGEVSGQHLIQDAYCVWETMLEKLFVDRLCSGNSSAISDYRLANRVQRLVRREVSMLNSQPKRVLFIGSGPFPISSLWLNRILGVPTDGIDISAVAVESSKELIGKIALNREVQIHHQESQSYDVSSYDMVVIALLAKPKAQILENIYASARRDCIVICRTSFGLRSLVYEPTFVSPELLEKFMIEDMRVVKGANDDLVSSLRLSIRR